MLNTSYKIRAPFEEEGPAIISLAKNINQFSHEDVCCIEDLWKESLSNETDIDRYHFIIAISTNQVVGFACYGHRPLTVGTYDFYWLGVDPTFRKQGIGRALIDQVENEIRDKKGYLVIIETSSLDTFASPRAIYSTFGYQVVAQIPDFYKPGDSLVIFTKMLSPN
jgi:ribosomal protein S18 acetylase RimI-like enzyme